tara:strand:- start:3359 stop:4048 length:690 start_codon:yes stop_codon:yes gene_type:complete
MGTILQDMMGMLSRKKVATPKTDDYITVARYTSAQEILKPFPKVETELVTMGAIKTFVSAGSSDSQTLLLEGTDLSISNGNTVDLSNLDSQQLSINGNDLTISSGNTVDLSNLDLSGSVAKLIPFNVLAGDQGSSTIPSDYNLIDISWDGLGNGRYTLNLPPAASMTYRNVRIITDGTLDNGAKDKIDITPAGSERIDGDASFEISKRYEGISIWSNGTEWIIIQAKAH